jgi:hypothetical protein
VDGFILECLHCRTARSSRYTISGARSTA